MKELTDVGTGYTVNADGQILYNGWDADRAKFIYRALQAGKKDFRIPIIREKLQRVLGAYETDLRAVMKKASTTLYDVTTDRKLRESVEPIVMRRLTKAAKRK